MVELDATTADCLVFTFKEGLLSKVAHDLKIRVARFRLELDPRPRSVRAVFDAGSLQVVSAMRSGREARGALSDGDRRKIEGNLAKDVLESRRYPEIRFESRGVTAAGGAFEVAGELTLHGRTRALRLQVRREGERLVTEAMLHQPDYGIKPYSAMFGTLKIQPGVQVRLSVPAADLAGFTGEGA